jgi:cell division inhibitor SepF
MQDYQQEKEGFFSKIIRFFSGYGEEEEDGFGEPSLEEYPARRKWPLRLYSRKDIPIYTKELTNFEGEVKEVALRLRQGFIVIVNLEQASEETARRIVDFLSGVAFGIRGNHQKIGSKVFLFAPSGYSIF